MNRNRSFDFFRGLMALLVCLGHYDFWSGQYTLPLSFILAVDFFLVLSGFVLAASLLHRAETGAPVSSAAFLVARYQRLAPVYLVCVALTAPFVAWWVGLSGPSLRDLGLILTFSQMISGHTSQYTTIEPIAIAWSLSAELWVGLVLLPPAVVLYQSSPRAAVALLCALFALGLGTIILLSPDYLDVHFDPVALPLRFGLVRCAMDYAIGILTFLLFTRRPAPHPLAQSLIQTGCIALALILYTPLTYDRRLEYLAPALFAMLILSLASRQGLVYRLASGRAGQVLGDMSYPLYLIHPLFIFLFGRVWKITEATGAMAAYAALCILAALALNRWVERPCIARFQRRADRTGTAAAARPNG